MLQYHSARDYDIHPEDLGIPALQVINELHKSGFQAYVVGGGIRDLLLGLHPKDFDIATNATPEQVKRVFGRQCQIIGRRFQLAHVYQDRHLFEVATFRAPHDNQSQRSQTSAHGLIVRDNVWGTIDQDALRRDFTANALYYNPKTGEILDFANGLADIQHKILRMIGEPNTRYREDPVRMLRAARLSTKLDFTIEAQSLEPIYHLAYLLKSISAHRLYDESLKLFSCGHLQNLLIILQQLNLFSALFPLLEECVVNSELVQLAAKNTDERLQQGKSINPAFFYAVLLWNWQQKLTAQQLSRGEDFFPAQQNAAIETLNLQSKSTAIPRFVGQTIRDIWELQPRLAFPKAKVVPKLISQPRFRAGFDFLWLREQTGDDETNGMAAWWESYQNSNSDEQEKLLKALDKQRAKTIAKEKADKAEAIAKKTKKRKTKPVVSTGENL